ncbi:unnamed protein product [Prunus armeniaca]
MRGLWHGSKVAMSLALKRKLCVLRRKKWCPGKRGKVCKRIWLRGKGEKGKGSLSVSSGSLTETLSNVRTICQKRENMEDG